MTPPDGAFSIGSVAMPKTLTLTETGIARLADGSEALNIDPIWKAIQFLTEGRSRPTSAEEPDLSILAFDVIQAIILGGPLADELRKVKAKLDERVGKNHRIVMAVIEQAAFGPWKTDAPLNLAAEQVRSMLRAHFGGGLENYDLRLFEDAVREFRTSPKKNWVTATAHLLVACNLLGHACTPDEDIADAVERSRVSIANSLKKRTAKATEKPKTRRKRRLQ